MKKIFIILLLLLQNFGIAKGEETDVNHLALAGRLIKDGHYSRAKDVLKSLQGKVKEEDLGQYDLLNGLAFLYERDFSQATNWFAKAVKEKKIDSVVYAYYAQALYGLNDFEGVVDKLEGKELLMKDISSLSIIKSKSYRQLGDMNGALKSLYDGISYFPDNFDLALEEMDIFLSLGLVEQSYAKIPEIIQNHGNGLPVWLRIAKIFSDYKQTKKLLVILEQAHLIYPYNEPILTQLAVSNLRIGRTLNAAILFEQAALHFPQYYKEAAELYMQVKNYSKALALNGFITDNKIRLRQRVAILTQQQRFEQVLGLVDALSRHELLNDQELRYAIAYAYFQTKNYSVSKTHLALITDSKLFEKATQLRKQMQSCSSTPWKCM